VALDGVTATAMAVIVTMAAAVFVESATVVAVSVTFRSVAGFGGAVYVVGVPLAVVVGDTEPHCAVEQETVHVTPRFPLSFAALAVKLVVAAACKEAEGGETETIIGGVDVLSPPQPVQTKKTEREKMSISQGENCGLGRMANLPKKKKPEPREWT